jgi:hypothetical protein
MPVAPMAISYNLLIFSIFDPVEQLSSFLKSPVDRAQKITLMIKI